jgi:hypothetical protein
MCVRRVKSQTTTQAAFGKVVGGRPGEGAARSAQWVTPGSECGECLRDVAAITGLGSPGPGSR